MAFDGSVVHALVSQFNNEILNCRINRIIQTSDDEIVLNIKGADDKKRLVLNANPTLPLCLISEESKQSLDKAPNFLMVLRKHIQNGKIVNITNPNMDRAINFEIDSYDELGDLKNFKLIIELMGKHSNIILINDKNIIIDAIKHIGFNTSSVREVLPGKAYFLPNSNSKINPLIQNNKLEEQLPNFDLVSSIVNTFNGFSKTLASEVVYRAGLDERKTINDLNNDEISNLNSSFNQIVSSINNNEFKFKIYYKDSKPFEFGVVDFKMYQEFETKSFDDCASLINNFYKEKSVRNKINQNSSDLRKIVSINLERTNRKYDIQLKQLEDTNNKEKYKIYGELLKTYSYEIKEGSSEAILKNFYDNDNEIRIPLDKNKSIMQNSNHFFNKYNKLKRTKEALDVQILDTKEELQKLESIKLSLELAESNEDLNDIKQELIEYGYIKFKKSRKLNTSKSKPIHYKTPDGFEIYVGKNNIQNDYITNTLASKKDMWFHSKTLHGSHVILKYDGRDFPDHIYELCANLAAYYSKGREQSKVEVDYTSVSNLKKVKNAAIGFVIYHTNYSIMAIPRIDEGLIII